MEKIIDMAMAMSHNYQGTVTFNCCFGNTCTSIYNDNQHHYVSNDGQL